MQIPNDILNKLNKVFDKLIKFYDHSSMERKTYLPLIKAYVYEEGVDDYE